jgi:hypothetical protein
VPGRLIFRKLHLGMLKGIWPVTAELVRHLQLDGMVRKIMMAFGDGGELVHVVPEFGVGAEFFFEAEDFFVF